MFGVSFVLLSQSIDLILDLLHLLLRFFAGDFLLHFNRSDLGLRLCLDASLATGCLCLLLLHLLFLLHDLQLCPLLLDLNVVMLK